MYLSVKDISSKDLQSIRDNPPNYWWLIASVLIALTSHLLRAIRWRMLIEPVAEKPGLPNTFFAVIIGYMTNYAPLPRLGEVYRCVILSRYEEASFTTLVGTVIVERIIDTLTLVVLFFIMLLLRAQKVYGVVMPHVKSFFHAKLGMIEAKLPYIIIALIVVAAALLFILKKRTGFMGKIKTYIQNFWQGIKSVGKLERPVLFWVYSLGIWLMYLLSTYLCFLCFSQTSGLALADALVVLIFSGLGVIITPGGVGAVPILIKNVMEKIYKIAAPIPFALGWIIWGSQFLLIITLGLVSLMLLPILNKK